MSEKAKKQVVSTQCLALVFGLFDYVLSMQN